MDISTRQRGGCLALYLVIGFIGVISSIIGILLNLSSSKLIYPAWYTPTLIVLVLPQLFSKYGVYKWKKWGFYLSAIILPSGSIVSLLRGKDIAISFVGLIIGVPLLWYLIHTKWSLFED